MPEDTISSLADVLEDLGQELTEAPAPELACALIAALAQRGLIVFHAGHQAAAERTFYALTEWMRENPDGRCTAIFGRSTERIHVTVSGARKSSSFEGVDAQDAYAKAAQAILFGVLNP